MLDPFINQSYDILLISGKQGSGKTTTSTAVCARLNQLKVEVVVLKFADPLYQLHDMLLDFMAEAAGTGRVKKDGKLLQYLGTEWGREQYGRNVWCDILRRRIREISKQRSANGNRRVFIIDDCRFENEFDAFPEALRVRLFAPEFVRKDRTESWRPNTEHASETDLDRYSDERKFDLMFDTSVNPEPHITSLLVAELLKRTWFEDRLRKDGFVKLS